MNNVADPNLHHSALLRVDIDNVEIISLLFKLVACLKVPWLI